MSGGSPTNHTDPLGLNQVSGVITGAELGSVFGPAGTIVGGILGAGVGAWIGWNVIGPIFHENGEACPAPSGNKDPRAPTGRKGSPLDVAPGTNEPTNIGGRDYSGHAIDRIQGRGMPPSAVEDTINNGQASPGNMPGTTVYTGPNGTVVTGNGGRVVTVIPR